MAEETSEPTWSDPNYVPNPRYIDRKLSPSQAEAWVVEQVGVDDLNELRTDSLRWRYIGQPLEEMLTLQRRGGTFYLYDSVTSKGEGQRGVFLVKECRVKGALLTYSVVDA